MVLEGVFPRFVLNKVYEPTNIIYHAYTSACAKISMVLKTIIVYDIMNM